VDGAIHRAAGPKLLEECRTVGGCPTGEARITGGYNLSVRNVIHTVGPVYTGKAEDSGLLAQCYSNSLHLAVKHHLTSIAFPAISCGVYGYPVKEACKIAMDTTCSFLRDNSNMAKVIFIVFSFENFETYSEYFRKLAAE
jgi:O-acetyl-ADP-ribose deacetylase (regulator of RNase III)